MKSIFASKTFWFNLLAGFPVLLDALLPILNDPQFQDLIPAHYLPYYTLALTIGNIWLRTRTSQPVSMK